MPGTFSYPHTLTDQTYYPDVPADGAAARQQFMDLLNAVKDNMNNVLAQGSDVTGLAGAGRTTETVKGNADSLNAHLADFVRNPAYGPTTGGTGTPNAYLFSSTPALPALVDGVSAYLDVNVANTGAATLNWDGKGAHAIVDGKGNALIGGKMPLNGIVGVRYNASTGNFQLQGEGGEYGTALASDVRNTKTLGTENGVILGTLDLSNVIPANILNGVTIDGVAGTAKRRANGTVTSGTTTYATTLYDGTGGVAEYAVTVTGLLFTPRVVVLRYPSTYNKGTVYDGDGFYNTGPGTIFIFDVGTTMRTNTNFTVSAGQFTLPVAQSNKSYYWEAFE